MRVFCPSSPSLAYYIRSGLLWRAAKPAETLEALVGDYRGLIHRSESSCSRLHLHPPPTSPWSLRRSRILMSLNRRLHSSTRTLASYVTSLAVGRVTIAMKITTKSRIHTCSSLWNSLFSTTTVRLFEYSFDSVSGFCESVQDYFSSIPGLRGTCHIPCSASAGLAEGGHM